VIIGWVFFYFEDMKSIKYMFGAMFGVTDKALYMPTDTTTLTNNVFLLVVCVIAVTPLLKNIGDKLQTKLNQSPNGVIVNGVLTFAFQAAVLLLCAACLVGSTYNPFLYFRF
jgi:alginate O-acetyltransferase complex protein AlgI